MMADDWNLGAEDVVCSYGRERLFSCQQSSVALSLWGCCVEEDERWVWRGVQGSFGRGEAPGELFCLQDRARSLGSHEFSSTRNEMKNKAGE